MTFAVCPTDWDKCFTYSVVNTPKTWADAQTYCEDEGGNLVSVHSAEENDHVAGLVSGELWLGGSDADAEDDWRWTDGSSFSYSNWAPHQPANYGGNEDCLVINWLGIIMWNDQPCSEEKSFVCKMTI